VNIVHPTRVAGLADVDALACGTDFCCVLTGPEVRCWGSNAAHQLGDGTTTSRATSAAPRF
jgi:alpha-tubulin suppressor-like RCC1 family protein